MTGLAELLNHLRRNDVRLSLHGRAVNYDAPQDAVTDDLLARLRHHKHELVELLATDTGVEVEASAPATYAQRRMFGQHVACADPAAFNVALQMDISGSLDPDALARSLDAVIERQRALRTRLLRDGKDVLQEVVRVNTTIMTLEDLTVLPPDEIGSAIDRRIQSIANRPFDMSVAPLLRANLLRTADQDWVLVLVVHHAVFDGWSLSIMMREWSALYAVAMHGIAPTERAAGLATMPMHYTDVARWQREYLTGTELDRLRDYWLTALAGSPLTMDLPYDQPRPALLSGGGIQGCMVPGEIVHRLKRLARDRGTTLYVVLLSAFGLLLGRLCGQDEAVLASTNANRIRREHEPIVGLFANNVILRLRLAQASTFAELIDQTGPIAFAAADHQAMPLGMLTEQLPMVPKPFPQVVFVVQNLPATELLLSGASVHLRDIPLEASKTDLTFILVPRGDNFEGVFSYHSDLFKDATVATIGRSYVELLDRASRDPHMAIDKY